MESLRSSDKPQSGSAAKQLMVSRIVGTHANNYDDPLVDLDGAPA